MNTPSKESSYGTPSYGTPSYGTPSYGTPEREPGSGPELKETPGKKIFNSFDIKHVTITYYTIPEKTILYHGSDTITLENGIPKFSKGLHTFFALSEEYAAKYAKKGNIFCFKTNKKMDLVAMDKPNVDLYENAARQNDTITDTDSQKVDGYDIQTIMRENYGFPNNHKRKSEPEKDNALSQYLCDKCYNGYAAGHMKGALDFTDDLDPEIVLCNIDNLDYIGSKKVRSHDEAPRIQDKRRKSRRTYYSPEKDSSDKGKGLFKNNDDDDDDDDVPSIFTGKLGFGNNTTGGKKKKTLKRKRKTSKKKQFKKKQSKKKQSKK